MEPRPMPVGSSAVAITILFIAAVFFSGSGLYVLYNNAGTLIGVAELGVGLVLGLAAAVMFYRK